MFMLRKLRIDLWQVISYLILLGQGLKNPHDIEVDPVNLRVYVGELDPTKVWRFDMKADDGSGGHGNIIHSKYTQSRSLVTLRTGRLGIVSHTNDD